MDEEWFQTAPLADSLFKQEELPSVQQVQTKLLAAQQKLTKVESRLLGKQLPDKKVPRT